MAMATIFANGAGTANRGFFEPLQYRRCVDHYEFGHDLLEELSSMLEERSAIENSYVSALRSWSRKWHAELTKVSEYPSNKKVWDQVVSTGEQMADVHQSIASTLRDNIQPKLKQWKKDNYEKSIINYKKSIEFEKEFEQVQKPWMKLLESIQESKKAYHKTTKLLKQAEQKKETMPFETPPEMQKQVVDNYIQIKLSVEAARLKYQYLLRDVASSAEPRQRYEANMIEIFQHTQAFEKKRLDFFKEIFAEYTKTLQQQPVFSKILDDYVKVLQTHNTTADLDTWYKTDGPGSHSNYPAFEESQDAIP
ncbi:unnamed protein product [Rotaria magnacalcarata]|uniref:F-BAR domain-containing protein n=3 Tax=Rotaria magnacalcarata TaxID=392030 RepID=A0A816P5P6_9BILA|nr:unnamed protein product [Rotaria magnacalcarata]CAF2044841.1 unnamed protein product [Rotaria magnacalcarata]CAF2074767.1 unnamed protein product [Rotaria magnacalcarata]CAF2145784.1 unnamed protein product [Rotaria magnacalcarata]